MSVGAMQGQQVFGFPASKQIERGDEHAISTYIHGCRAGPCAHTSDILAPLRHRLSLSPNLFRHTRCIRRRAAAMYHVFCIAHTRETSAFKVYRTFLFSLAQHTFRDVACCSARHRWTGTTARPINTALDNAPNIAAGRISEHRCSVCDGRA